MQSISSRRYLSLCLRRLATDRLTRQSQRPADRPLALVGAVRQARLLIAINDAAARVGLRVGMSFADACLVRMTEVLPDSLVLTTDADFHIYRRHSRQVVPCVLPP